MQFKNEELRKEHIIDRLHIFKLWASIQYSLSGVLILSFVLRQIFNICRDKKINSLAINKWLIMDVLYAICSFVLFYFLANHVDHEWLMDEGHKDYIDNFVALVMTLAWIRFFSMFLIVKEISKMMLTLVNMLMDVVPFLFIMACYIFFAIQMFSTLYQDVSPKFQNIVMNSGLTTYDTAMGNYDYEDIGDEETVFSLVMIVNLFLLNILLINFMIAILSSTYVDMLASGDFKFKCTLYQYCERYMIAFSDKNYGELVIHSPPLNVFCILMIPFCLF